MTLRRTPLARGIHLKLPGNPGQSHGGSFSDGHSISDVNARASPNREAPDKGNADDLSVKDP